MSRFATALCLIAIIATLTGCGGSNGSESSGTVAIEQYSIFGHSNESRTRFFPRTTTIVAGMNNGITWINQTPGRHQIMSGIVRPKANPPVPRLITITFGSFSPNHLEANLGDTIQVSNGSGRNFTMQMVDDNGRVESTFNFTIGGSREIPFPGAGVWVLQDPDSQLVATVTLYGDPEFDGRFQSGILGPGGVFQVAFPVPGTFNYYDANPDDPSHVYTTGKVVVQ